MPGPALHHMIANRLRQNINNGTGLGPMADYLNLQKLLQDKKNHPYLFLGCQGPDFLFFNTKDWPAGIGDAVELYYEVYDAFEDFKKALLDLVPQPVLDALEAVGAAADEVVQNSSTLTELQQLFGDMQAVVDGLMANVTEWIKKFVSDFDVYSVLEHPYRDGQAKNAWWWFDVMHYRKTARFAKALLDAAPADSPLHLYATGYLTHVTADTVGHAYVNINDGGPYRNQSARHKTGENYQDVFNHLNHTTEDWNRSKTHVNYNFNFDGTVSDPGDEDEIPNANSHMPADLAQLIVDTINKIYKNGDADDNEYGKNITTTDVNNAYRLYYKWFRSSTDTGTLPKPVPYSLSAELEEVWDTAMDNLGDIGDWLEDAIDNAGSFSFLDILLALAALVAAAVAAAAALIDAVLGAITTLTVAGIRAAACLIYEQLYNAFQNFRLAVSLNGLAYPMQEHLDEPRFGQFKNTSFPDPNGVVAGDLKNMLPKMNVILPSGGFLADLYHREKHLAYPPGATPSEPGSVMGAPDSYFDKTSLWYAFGDIPLNQQFIDELATLSGNEDEFRAIIRKQIAAKKSPTLGNALMLTEEIYDRWKNGSKIPDFNLDADRGYAYTCWTQRSNDREEPKELEQHRQQESGQPITPVELQFIAP
ncbi:hypothetical protein [Flavitalea sp.]|nr:hypothetical protein [Flavitalea sp.]